MLKQTLISCALALTASLSGPAFAQEFPNQPIHIVVPYGAGGGSDILARPLAGDMAERLKSPVVIDNKAGAGGNIGASFVARSNPDGYTLVLANNSHTINPFIYADTGYDMVKDFAPVSLLATSPIIVVVHKDVPAKSLAEFVALAKKSPGKYNYGSPGIGTPGHLAQALFNKQAGIEMVNIVYKGTGPTTLALLGKEVEMFFGTPAALAPHIKSGEFRALAVTSKKRFAAFPTVPTVAESGLPGMADYSMEIWWGLLAPAGTSPKVLDKLQAAVAAGVIEPKIRDPWVVQGMVPTSTTRAEFQTLIKEDLVKWQKVVRDNNIKIE
jgi:tripartite-type tricarboxylate transporter receptor subunit TctC